MPTVSRTLSFGFLMIGNNHENYLISLLETLKETKKAQWMMNCLIYGLGPVKACNTGMKADHTAVTASTTKVMVIKAYYCDKI